MRICIPQKGQYMRLNEPIDYHFQCTNDYNNEDYGWMHRDMVFRLFLRRAPAMSPTPGTYNVYLPVGLVMKIHNYANSDSVRWNRIKIGFPAKKNNRQVIAQLRPGTAIACWSWFPTHIFQGIDVDLITETKPS